MARASDSRGVEEPLLLISPSPSPHEAAAIVAALERFVHDRAAASPARPAGVGGWLRAARLEGVGSEPDTPAPRGGSSPWRAAVDARFLNP
jgi:hypothetical protein